MGTEGKNREQRRKLNKGRAHASKATAIVMAGLMATRRKIRDRWPWV